MHSAREEPRESMGRPCFWIPFEYLSKPNAKPNEGYCAMRMKLPLVLLLMVAWGGAAADILGVRAGVAYWSYDVDGFLRYQSTSPADDIDVQDDLGYGDDSLVFAYIQLEHPIPLLPNVRLSKTSIDTEASGTMTANFTYGGVNFSIDEAVDSALQLDQVDLTLYYQILDNVVGLNVGLNGKYLDSTAEIASRTVAKSETAEISAWVPMVYAGVEFNLPFSGLSLSADGSYIGYSGSSFYDYTVRLTYDTPWIVGVDVGYRSIKLDLDDIDDSYASIEFSGIYGGLYAGF